MQLGRPSARDQAGVGRRCCRPAMATTAAAAAHPRQAGNPCGRLPGSQPAAAHHDCQGHEGCGHELEGVGGLHRHLRGAGGRTEEAAHGWSGPTLRPPSCRQAAGGDCAAPAVPVQRQGNQQLSSWSAHPHKERADDDVEHQHLGRGTGEVRKGGHEPQMRAVNRPPATEGSSQACRLQQQRPPHPTPSPAAPG